MLVSNDGFKIIFQNNNFGFIKHGAHKYYGKEIHLHHPSEHTVLIFLKSVWKR